MILPVIAVGGWPGWTRFPITPLCYTQATGTWMWYWRDRHLRCHRYDQVRPTPDIGGLLREIGHDQIAIFWQDVVGMSTETPHTVRRNARTYQFLPDLQHQDSFRRLSSRLDWPDGMPGVVSCKSLIWAAVVYAGHLRCRAARGCGISYSRHANIHGGDCSHIGTYSE
ncbi:MAG TPA: DUF3024 domain-containing protein [Streptosporangiaceae bacterium]|nr:DUF3024 domain-containing protein [Streptosporangiaceae bacterium]